MALTYGGMPCAICSKPIDDPSRDTFAMTMWAIDDLRFARLDDAACHQSCIDGWTYRDDFIEYYNRNCKDELFIDRYGHVAYRFDYGDWFVCICTMAFAAVFCGPPLAMLELNCETKTQRIAAFVSPYIVLIAIVLLFALQGTLQGALIYGMIAWVGMTLIAFMLAVVVPVFRDRCDTKPMDRSGGSAAS